ncbi:MAG: ComEC/Rec2 family competence protein [Oscillatoriaceae bacterium SKW80]|nr:ComEC/Rec2 family competence protein [Oscillatoriaceae bacterium SKYG93]MCX8122270.1 ComEC/Rec2 family competence protein [Oscillatoriaceae bacterium SKW80]MDW8454556.1 ComEC/Rec2 family competence protein [Oscillatoriaceae cyanobacterium SKYGB_i_bin93]HIK29418.1 ComEC/Rec2 family competence protein [Oscillatoriaceae cyanobacterium M7585_C2015_266]
MSIAGGVLLSLAYILGLLSTAIPRQIFALPLGGLGMLVLGLIAAITLPSLWPTGPKRFLWLSAGIIGFLATLYLQSRVPQPAATDISRFVLPPENGAKPQEVIVWGKLDSMPRLTRSQKAQFWLQATSISQIVSQETASYYNVTGKLYVTVPLLQATGLYPGQTVAVTGKLYKPKPATNPGSFDFQAYLAKEGAFAGLAGLRVTLPNDEIKPKWGWWAIRQRIVQAQVEWLGVPTGPIVSAIALGKQAVDVPFDIKDEFRQVGLSHALAASGAQVSLILGIVLGLTKFFSERIQLIAGTGALILMVGLTGGDAPILRAAVMGFAALLALVLQRQVKPLSSLLLSATILLLFNPNLIWDLGFQLSFLATLGLLVTQPAIMARLDWMPVAIASLIATPLAASTWVLPLQIYYFNTISLYCVIVNVISAPLISIISIGGTASALAALIWQKAGTTLAWLLYYPAQALIALAKFFSHLPGNTVATGSISLLQMLILYALWIGVWLIPWWHKGQRWILALLAAVSFIVVPLWHAQSTIFQVTLLATRGEKIVIVQDKGEITLINSGDDDTVRFALLPFLTQQGINKIDWALATESPEDTRSGWGQILQALPIKTFYGRAALDSALALAVRSHKGSYLPLPIAQQITVGSTSVKLINTEPLIVELFLGGKKWLLLEKLNPNQQQLLLESGVLQPAQVLWWEGDYLSRKLLETIKPKVAISSSYSINPNMSKYLLQNQIQLLWTERDGAIRWTPDGGFEKMLEATENETTLL